VSLLTDFRNLIQDLLVFQRSLRDLEVRVDRLSQENVALRHDLIRTQQELHGLREQLDLRDENLLLRIQQALAEKLLPGKRR
jgi:predicted  nucleic acid-binding Zn-ribbon protein